MTTGRTIQVDQLGELLDSRSTDREMVLSAMNASMKGEVGEGRRTLTILIDQILDAMRAKNPSYQLGLLVSFKPVGLSKRVSDRLGVWKIISRHNSDFSPNDSFVSWSPGDSVHLLRGYAKIDDIDTEPFLPISFGYNGFFIISESGDDVAKYMMNHENPLLYDRFEIAKFLTSSLGIISMVPMQPFDDAEVSLRILGRDSLLRIIAQQT